MGNMRLKHEITDARTREEKLYDINGASGAKQVIILHNANLVRYLSLRIKGVL
jgi:hypothetical protein